MAGYMIMVFIQIKNSDVVVVIVVMTEYFIIIDLTEVLQKAEQVLMCLMQNII